MSYELLIQVRILANGRRTPKYLELGEFLTSHSKRKFDNSVRILEK